MSAMHERLAGVTALAVAITLLSGCSAASEKPPVEKIEQPASATPSPTPSPTVAEAGTREAPLAVGDMRRLAEGSMWTVGASAATKIGEGYVALPLHIEMDWDAAGAAGLKDGEGADPVMSLYIEYVTAGGRSYDIDETFIDAVPNQLHEIGTLYPPARSVEANYVVTLPDAEIAGGVWKVTNTNGDGVFIATS